MLEQAKNLTKHLPKGGVVFVRDGASDHVCAYLKKHNIAKRASLYVSFSNLFTFTNYDGMNPEVGYGGYDSWASGIDLGLYPLPRTVSVGLNLTL